MATPKLSKSELFKKKRLASKADYQQGFSVEGAALLARPWLVEEPPENFQDFTLASFIKTDKGYS
tara:strand:- start:134 stop:328 length:195 start_codon:yes stop_codon:yes gene_type:complete